LTTFIYGEKYQNYIPLLVFSAHLSYPEYDIILFVYNKLDENVRRQLENLKIDTTDILNS
jgi:DNA-binding MarR family transcriptional regulator